MTDAPTTDIHNFPDRVPAIESQPTPQEMQARLLKAMKDAGHFLSSQSIARRLAYAFAMDARRRQRNKQNFFVPAATIKARRKRERDARRRNRL